MIEGINDLKAKAMEIAAKIKADLEQIKKDIIAGKIKTKP